MEVINTMRVKPKSAEDVGASQAASDELSDDNNGAPVQGRTFFFSQISAIFQYNFNARIQSPRNDR